MTWTYTALASLIEGITEFLPISSTGHLIILNHLLGVQESDLLSSFDIFIQLGAILAVVHIYYQEILQDKKIIKNILLSFIPTAIIGFTLYPFIKEYLLNNLPVTIFSLFAGGVLIFFLPKNPKTKNPSAFDYFKIGLFQSVSVIPGTSRALMSIVGGLLSGLSLNESVKYSFLLAIPTIGAATALDLVKNRDFLLQNLSSAPYFIVGFILSFLVAKITIKFFLNLVKTKDFKIFGYYRIILSLLLILIFFSPL